MLRRSAGLPPTILAILRAEPEIMKKIRRDAKIGKQKVHKSRDFFESEADIAKTEKDLEAEGCGLIN